ncbi:MAG TPA: GspH/FimT family pseudopilin [Gemmatimonadaceae bacterium]
MQSRKAFTVIETTVVVAVMAALTAIALPRAAGFIDRIEVRGAVAEIESLFSLARHAAIARGARVTLEIDPSTSTISVHAPSGLLRSREIGEAHGVLLSANRTTITYSPIGLGYGAANSSLIVSRGNVVDTVVVSRLGRVRH